MNDFTHIWKFLAKRCGLYFPCVFEFAICRSWRLWRGLYSRPNLFNCFRQKDYNGNMTSSLGCIICCWLFTGNHGKTWHLKAIVRLESPMGTEPMKIDLRLHVMSFKTKCKFTSGFYWLHFGKTNSTNRSTWTSVISMRSLVNEEEECMITIWYWERIVIFASGFVNLFNLERSLKLCQKHLAAKGVALGISSSPLLIRVERAGGRRWRKWTDSLFTSLWFSEKKLLK